MNDEELRRRLRRPPPESPPAEAPPSSSAGTANGSASAPSSADERPSVAPSWQGACLRLAGELSTPSLVLRQRDGKVTALVYGYLTAATLLPDGAVELDFVNHAVSIRGRRLSRLFDAVALQRALEIAESRSDFDPEDDHAHVETIAIVPTQPR